MHAVPEMIALLDLEETLDPQQPLFRAPAERIDFGAAQVLLWGEQCHWVAVDENVADLIEAVDGRRSFEDLADLMMPALQRPRAWVRWWTGLALAELIEKGVLSQNPAIASPPARRSQALNLERMRELWIHTNNSCNLSCAHCLVGSAPGGEPGLPTGQLEDLFRRGHELGVRRFYFTGGEPFVRPDAIRLARFITEDLASELIVITNATIFTGRLLKEVLTLDREKIRLQVSLDGTTPASNDVIRGRGVFDKVTEAVRGLAGEGFRVALTSVVGRGNLHELEDLPELASRLGAGSVHLMWPHRKGRVLEKMPDLFPEVEELCALTDAVLEGCHRHGVDFDNYGSVLFRINGQPGVRFDLSNAGWDSLFVDRDGGVYPSAVFSQEPAWAAGSVLELDLEEIWREAPILQELRRFSQADIPGLEGDPYRWFLGGGDIEYAAHAADTQGIEALKTPDPYYPVYRHLARRALAELVSAGVAAWNRDGSYEGPGIYHVMGDGAIACGTEGVREAGAGQVQTLHSNCVLSFDVDKPRALVRDFYGKAAVEPQESLCCPVRYDPVDADHIPKEVLDRFYGCGSPVADAGISSGETVVDLGCGAGIDCFIAARKVGPTGRVIGVDMTGEMLAVARENRPLVAERLGYDVTEFRKGYLESIPLADGEADLVVSNCVINLSPDKRRVFREIYRVLGVRGRVVVADIVCEGSVPPHLRVQEHLWGECISGALSEEELIRGLLKAGFHGVTLLKRSFWREVESHRFYSITVAGYRWPPAVRQSFGEIALYRGPFAEVTDDSGQVFQRGIATPVDHATAERLRIHPYDRFFQILGATELPSESRACCSPGEDCGC